MLSVLSLFFNYIFIYLPIRFFVYLFLLIYGFSKYFWGYYFMQRLMDINVCINTSVHRALFTTVWHYEKSRHITYCKYTILDQIFN